MAVNRRSYWLGMATGEVIEHRLNDGARTGTLSFSQSRVSCLAAWSRRARRADQQRPGILLASDDRKVVHGWDLCEGKKLFQTRPQRSKITSLDWIPSGLRALVGSSDGGLRFLDLRTGRYTGDRMPHGAQVTSIATNPARRRLIAGADDGSVRLWSMPIGRPSPGGQLHAASITLATFMPDLQRAISIDANGLGRLWKLETSQATGEPLSTTRRFDHVALSEDGRTLAAVDASQGNLTFWNLDSQPAITRRLDLGKDWAEEPAHPSPEAWSPDGLRELRIENDGMSVRLWHRSGEPLTPTIDLAVSVHTVAFVAPHWARVEGPNGYVGMLELPPDKATLPAWFVDFAEQYVSDQTDLSIPDTEKSPTVASRYADWLLDHSRSRPLSPQANLGLQAYVDEVLEHHTAAVAKHVLQIDPANPRAIRLMRELNFGRPR